MPGRWIREGINSSSRINSLSPQAELFYRRLMTVVDDHGRFHGAPGTLLGACWPTCPEKQKESSVTQWLAECTQLPSNCKANQNPLITIYEVDGAKYIQLSDFRQNNRSKSKFPAPENQLQSNCEADAQPNRISISISKSISGDETVSVPPDNLHEVSEAFDRHLKHNRKEPRDLIIQQVISMNGKFNWDKFRNNHKPYCNHYDEHGWDFCTLSFLGWINAGMPPAPKGSGRKSSNSSRQPSDSQFRD